MKVCKICKAEKPKTEFHRHKNYSDGLTRICKPCACARSKAWVEANRERHEANLKRYADANPEKRAEIYRKWVEANPNRSAEIKSQWKRRNPESARSYIKRRLQRDTVFHLKKNMRGRLWQVLAGKGWKKSRSSESIFGCTYEQLMAYLEKQFKPGMTWDNRTEWHVDHIVPLASAKTEEEVYALSHYSNLQPLWASENLAKGCAMPLRIGGMEA